MRTWRILAALMAALMAAPVLAQDQAQSPTPPSEPNVTVACVNAGSQYKVGEFACIAACHERRRLARCDALAEKGTWTYVEESCPTAMINAPWPSDWSEVPAVAAMSPIPLVVNLTAIPPEMPLTMAAFLQK